jgi:hypothetical protein
MYGYFYTPDNLIEHSNISLQLDEQFEINNDNEVPHNVKVEVLHPYIGYVSPNYQVRLKQHFTSTQKPIIIITGGSVAAQLSVCIRKRILHYFKEKNIRGNPFVVNYAYGGYKQPQQLITITYLLSLGYHIDYVINIDGFNDVVLPYFGNYKLGTFPFYPRNWAMRVKKHTDSKILHSISKTLLLRQNQAETVNTFRNSPLNNSIFYGFYITQILNKTENEIAAIDVSLSEDTQDGEFSVTGPYFEYDNLADLYRDSADVWLNSSILLNDILKRQSIKYYHFLQPNQYVPDSKPLSLMEKKHFYRENHPYKRGVLNGYPNLIKRGDILKGKGVNFYDLTMIFKNNTETLYKDDCCHFNKKGCKLLADYIVSKIVNNEK